MRGRHPKATAQHRYLCACGNDFEASLGAYGCTRCAGERGRAVLILVPQRDWRALWAKSRPRPRSHMRKSQDLVPTLRKVEVGTLIARDSDLVVVAALGDTQAGVVAVAMHDQADVGLVVPVRTV